MALQLHFSQYSKKNTTLQEGDVSDTGSVFVFRQKVRRNLLKPDLVIKLIFMSKSITYKINEEINKTRIK
jgi:hypothetical protein